VLGDITVRDSPTSAGFDLVARFYNLEMVLPQADQRLFSQLKTAYVAKLTKTAAEVIEALYEITP